MKILDQLPVARQHYLYNFRGESLRIKPYQIIIQVSISADSTWDPRTPVLPALLDTGNNHNFSIQIHHLRRWAGIDPRFLRSDGTVHVDRRDATLHSARVWIHRNGSRKQDLRGGQPFMLRLAEGIIVYPADGSDHPRLPLLGLRVIMDNDLKLTLDGQREHVSLRSPLW